MLKEDIKEAEKKFLNGTKDRLLGIHTEIISAKSPIDGQDGGMATALLLSGFKNGLLMQLLSLNEQLDIKQRRLLQKVLMKY